MLTPHHLRYYAHELTLRAGGLRPAPPPRSLVCQPHQLAAAAFALDPTRPHGVLLADEVGLGKSVQAGLVLAQSWAERRRRLLVLCPAGLRAQWLQLLSNGLALPATLLDRHGWPPDTPTPGVAQQVLIVSYGFALRRLTALAAVPWDWVVMDEAHKLRSAHGSEPGLAVNLRQALQGRRKLLLSATPLQNHLMELFGVSCLLSPHWLGPAATFRRRYVDQPEALPALRQRLPRHLTRTLRQALPVADRFPPRRVLTQCLAPSEPELALYQALSRFIEQASPALLPRRGRALLGLLLKKRLASSPAALLATLRRWQQRLNQPAPLDDGFWQQLWAQQGDETLGSILAEQAPAAVTQADRAALAALLHQVQSLPSHSKWQALLGYLTQGLARMAALGAPERAVLFTESVSTQRDLAHWLSQHGYAGQVVCVNGDSAGARPALLAQFCQQGQILIATEAAAEGVNLQCCALVVNLDLPWNPQRLEQRIGRCQRYGQRFEVAVLNLLSPHNLAERRLLTLLQQKSQLFDRLLGASEGVLGQLAPVEQQHSAWPALLASCRPRQAIEAEQVRCPQITVSAEQADQLLAPLDQAVRERLLPLPGLNLPDETSRLWQALRTGVAGQTDEERLSNGRALPTPAAYLLFDDRRHTLRLTDVTRLRGQAGWLRLDRLQADSQLLGLLCGACTDDGVWLDQAQWHALWQVPVRLATSLPAAEPPTALATEITRQATAWQVARLAQDEQWFAAQRQTLAGWVAQQVTPAETAVRRLQSERRHLLRAERGCSESGEQVRLQQALLTLADSVRTVQQQLTTLEEEQATRRAALLAEWQTRQRRVVRREGVFVVRWRVG